MTEGEPLQVTEIQPGEGDYKLPSQSVGYVKGHARMSTLLCLLSHVIDADIVAELKSKMSKLFESSRKIWCYRMTYGSKRDELFANFALSARGSIRKPPHTLQWVAALKKLDAADEASANSIIKAWNSQVARASHLAGAKAVGVRNVLGSMPEEVYELLLDHVSKCSWDGCALSDDVLQSKKIYPGFVFRATAKEWTARGKVTPETMRATALHITEIFRRTPKHLRRRPDRAHWEEISNIAAALFAMIVELKAACPISDDDLETELLGPWTEGAHTALQLELSEAVREKNATFVLTDLHTFKELMDKHSKNAPIAATGCAVTAETVEENAYELVTRQVDYDLQAFKVWKGRVKSIEHHAFHLRLEARQKAAQANKLAAQSFMAGQVEFLLLESTDKVLREVQQLQQRLAAKSMADHGCARPETTIATLCVLNWSAPSTIKKEHRVMQAEIASVLVNHSPSNVGILLDPMFAYKKGGVWLAEKEAHDLLTAKSLVLDRTWSLLFEAKKDVRDNRPLAYRGRILEGATTAEKSPWMQTRLYSGYTDQAQQLAAKDMVTWQDLQLDALPNSTDDSVVVVQGAHKFQQIGVDAAKKILLGLLEDSELGQRVPLLVVDIQCGVGNFADAFIEVRSKFNRPMAYVGLADDSIGLLWLQETKVDSVAAAIGKGELKVAGHNPNPTNINALVEQRPARPKLNLLVFGQEDSDVVPSCLHLPQATSNQWMSHPTYGARFNNFLDKMHEDHMDVELSVSEPGSGPAGCAAASDTAGGAAGSIKRQGSATNVVNQAKKKQRTAVSPAHIIETEKDVSPLLEVPLVGLKSGTGKLIILNQNRMQMVNTSDQDPLVVATGTVIAGFGRGRWKAKTADHDPEKEVLYKLEHYEDLVLNGTDAVPILDVVNEKRKTLPDCRVAYHDIVPLAPNDGLPVGAFKLAPTVEVAFQPQTQPADGSAPGHLQTRVAATCPISAWKGHYSSLMWSVKWGATGLMPVRPQIAFTTDVTISPGRSLILNY